jgi:hypothetical protein
MRTVLRDGAFDWYRFWVAVALDVVYLAIGALLFAWSVRYAREHGTLLAVGE